MNLDLFHAQDHGSQALGQLLILEAGFWIWWRSFEWQKPSWEGVLRRAYLFVIGEVETC